MAQFAGISGSAVGVPVNGAFVSLNDADIRSAVAATAGLAKSLAFFGSGIALATLAVSTFASLHPGRHRYGWHQLANVNTSDRSFAGVCLDEQICLNVEDHDLEIPVNVIAAYSTEYSSIPGGKSFQKARITLVDGSKYMGVIKTPKAYKFLTPLGIQSVKTDWTHRIEGTSIKESQLLKRNILNFLNKNGEETLDIIGDRAFSQFFNARNL